MFDQFLKLMGLDSDDACSFICRDGSLFVAVVSLDCGTHTVVVAHDEPQGLELLRKETHDSMSDAMDDVTHTLKAEYGL